MGAAVLTTFLIYVVVNDAKTRVAADLPRPCHIGSGNSIEMKYLNPPELP